MLNIVVLLCLKFKIHIEESEHNLSFKILSNAFEWTVQKHDNAA